MPTLFYWAHQNIALKLFNEFRTHLLALISSLTGPFHPHHCSNNFICFPLIKESTSNLLHLSSKPKPPISHLSRHIIATSRSLQSSDQHLGLLQSYYVKTKFGSRAFRFPALSIWISLPFHIHSVASLNTFKSALKTIYFQAPQSPASMPQIRMRP